MAEWLSFGMFSLAATIHFGFFIFESFWFQRPDSAKIFRLSPDSHRALKPWVLNQGYYNLFLSLGMFAGLFSVLRLQVMVAGALTGFAALSMLGAGIVLWISQPRMWRWALLQLLPPLLGLIFIFSHVFRYLG